MFKGLETIKVMVSKFEKQRMAVIKGVLIGALIVLPILNIVLGLKLPILSVVVLGLIVCAGSYLLYLFFTSIQKLD